MISNGFCLLLLAGMAASAGSASATSPPPVERRLRETAVIGPNAADVVLPRFSPESRRLAYAGYVQKDGVWLSEIRVVDLKTGRSRRLLSPEQSERAAVYSAGAFGLSWEGPNHLRAEVSDGDVGYTLFELDVERNKILRERYFAEDEEAPSATTKQLQKRLTASFPGWHQDALAGAATSAIDVRDAGVLLQQQYHGVNGHVWLLRPADQKAIRVLELPDRRAELVGGFGFRRNIFFAVHEGESVRVHVLRSDGRTEELLARNSADPNVRLRLRHCSAKACWALLELGSMHARASNVVLRVDALGQIEWSKGLAGLNDFSVSPNGEYLAGTFWQDEIRSLKVFRIRDY